MQPLCVLTHKIGFVGARVGGEKDPIWCHQHSRPVRNHSLQIVLNAKEQLDTLYAHAIDIVGLKSR